jgi:hypothetical protein
MESKHNDFLKASEMASDRLMAKHKIDPECGCYCPNGWELLVDALLEDLLKLEGFEPAMVVQIKSKFCGLRVYVDTKSIPEAILDDVNTLIYVAEGKSFELCEYCGAEATDTTPQMAGIRKCNGCKG